MFSIPREILMEILKIHPELSVFTKYPSKNLYFLDRNAVACAKKVLGSESGRIDIKDKYRYDILLGLDRPENEISIITSTIEWINPYSIGTEDEKICELKREFSVIKSLFKRARVDADFMNEHSLDIYGSHFSKNFEQQEDFIYKISKFLYQKKSPKQFYENCQIIFDTAQECGIGKKSFPVLTSILCLAQCKAAMKVLKFKLNYTRGDAYNAVSDIAMILQYILHKHQLNSFFPPRYKKIDLISFDDGFLDFKNILESVNLRITAIEENCTMDNPKIAYTFDVLGKAHFPALTESQYKEFISLYYGYPPEISPHTPTAPHS